MAHTIALSLWEYCIMGSSPQEATPKLGKFPQYKKSSHNQSTFSPYAPPIIQSAFDRTRQNLFEDKFVPWKFHPRNSPFEPSLDHQIFIHHVYVQQNRTESKNASRPLAREVDESYTLSITENGAVRITAVSSSGVLYALETFTQLFYQHSQSTSGVYTPYAPVTITDKPKFPHRGLNLDVARNYYPKHDILRTINALAWNKFNRLHLHITDSQSWPLEIPALPDLAIKGAYRKDLFYSPQDLQDIQQYGVARGIEVIVEIDMPGHTASIALSDPDLIAAFNVQPGWVKYGNEPPTGQLKLNSPAVYAFLEKLWNDLLPRVSPYSAYFHTGGDEVNLEAYNLDPTVRSNLSSVIKPFLQKLVDFNHDKLRAKGLTPIVWEEMLLTWNLTLGSDVIVQTWLSDEAVAQTVAKGHKALVGNYNLWYLDCGKGQWIDFYPASAANAYPFNDYCTPTKNWRLIYSYDPLSGIPPNATHLVLGGEVHMWSEQTDGVNLDDMVWPRASAAGEVLWSGAKNEAGENRSQIEASPRLSEIRERMVQRGVRAGPIQPVFCTQNGTQCAL
ncbi:N-acetyl-glucosamine-6-phosphate deacetylase [Sticta canariensis]|nr:N-acetyl-glucosamine-6-phosphate deacetylase [Sticta canariensis]